jgi:hypothetical protein
MPWGTTGVPDVSGVGRLGTLDADRKRLTRVLNAAFAEGTLTNDQFVELVGTPRIRSEADMRRANVVIAAYTTGIWTKIRTPEGRPAYRNWAEFCEVAVGVTEDFPLRGDARLSVVQALRNWWEPAEITEIASATGCSVRTIKRDVLKLNLVNPNRSDAQKRLGKGKTLEGAADTAVEKVSTALAEVSMTELAAYIRTAVPPTDFAGLLGGEYVAAMLHK